MANTASAEKRIRQTAKRTLRNQARKSRMRTFVKKVEVACASGDKAAAAEALRQAQPEMQRAVGKAQGHKTLTAALKAKYEPSGLPGQYEGLLGATLDRVERFAEAVASDAKHEKRARLAAGALYHAASAALIGRLDRRGRLLWSLPKGHLEAGETERDTAVREVAEETGIRGRIVGKLGTIDFWFVAEGRRVHKTVHHFLLLAEDPLHGLVLSDEDVEVSEVAWVPVGELSSRLAYADERKLAEVADELIDKLHNDGPSALPPLPHSSPRRRAQTHSHTRNRRTGETGPPKPRTNGCGQGP